MEDTEKNNFIENEILFGAITSPEYFEAIKDQVKPETFTSKFTSAPWKWLTEYYAEYGKQPQDIYSVFRLKKGSLKPAVADLTGKILEKCSEIYPGGREFDVSLMIAETRKYAESRRLQTAMERAQNHLETGDLAGAMGVLQKVVKPMAVSQENLGSGYTGAEILRATFREPEWIVKDLLPQGFSPLCGPPKKGKSWLALGLGLAIATGEPFLGRYEVTQGSVLYLDFEQPETKVKERLKTCLSGDQDRPGLENLYLQPKGSWPRIHQGGLEKLEAFVADHPDLKLVIIDVWRKFSRPRKASEENSYGTTYEDISPVKDFADKHNLCVLVIHHLSKGWKGYESPFEAFLGSTALAGASDNLFALVKGQGEADGVLWATGRDIEETQTALEFNRENCTWGYLGDAYQFELTQDQGAIVQVLTEAGGPMSPKQIANILDKPANNITQILFRMEGLNRVEKSGYGKYSLTITSKSNKSSNNNNTHKTSLNCKTKYLPEPKTRLNPGESLMCNPESLMGSLTTHKTSQSPETQSQPDNPIEEPESLISLTTLTTLTSNRKRNWDDIGEAVTESFRNR